MGTKYVKDIMTGKVLTIDEKATLREAIKMMAKNNVSSLLVECGGDRPFGIITRKDAINELVIREGTPDVPLTKVMTSPLIIVTPNLRIRDAAVLMEKFKVRRLPVLQQGKIAGIVSTSDVFRHLIETV